MARKSAVAAGVEEESEETERVAQFLASETVAKLSKKYGASVIMRASDNKYQEVPRISSGILMLDWALGGGWAAGRIHTIYGHKSSSKTTTLLRTVGNAQKLCANCFAIPVSKGVCACGNFRELICAFIDVEGSFDPKWASQAGVDNERLVYARPSFAEESLDIAEAVIRGLEGSGKGTVDVLVLDSLAFLTPQKEIEDSVAQETMGVQARLIGKGVRKLNSAVNDVKNDTGRCPTIFFTNQIRQKLGVMFGCFHHSTKVSFADGSQVPIGEVVRDRLEGPVLSWDGSNIVSRRITGWHENGALPKDESWLTFRVEGSGGARGAMGFTCTPNHVLVRADGSEAPADQVGPGDSLLSWREKSLTPIEIEIIEASMLGDCQITREGNLSLANSEQPEYLAWKLAHFSSLGFTEVRSCGRVAHRSPCTHELRLLRRPFYEHANQVSDLKNWRSVPLELLRRLSPRQLAIWMCDDGHYDGSHRRSMLCVKRLQPEFARTVADILAIRFPGVVYRDSYLVFQARSFELFSKEIAPYVPAVMAHKLLPEHRALANAQSLRQESVTRVELLPVRVIGVNTSKKKHRSRTKFDLTIEGNSYYLVGGDSRGVVVHNSNETCPGGLAPGFVSTSEVKVWSGKYEMDEATHRPLHVDMNFRVEKNKAGSAKMEGSFRMMLSQTESKQIGDIYEEDAMTNLSHKFGLIEGGGPSWTCMGEKFGAKSLIERRLLTDLEFKKKLRETLLKVLLAL